MIKTSSSARACSPIAATSSRGSRGSAIPLPASPAVCCSGRARRLALSRDERGMPELYPQRHHAVERQGAEDEEQRLHHPPEEVGRGHEIAGGG